MALKPVHIFYAIVCLFIGIVPIAYIEYQESRPASRESDFHRVQRIKAALAKDSLRVASMQKRASGEQANPSIHTQTGMNMGDSVYGITVSFGTPAQSQTVLFDTGSDLSWIQCKPCAKFCYPQRQPLFDPALSSTYENMSCDSYTCRLLPSTRCLNGNTCFYGLTYGDGSSSDGILASDTIRTVNGYVLHNFKFVCGQQNQGLLPEFAGVFGLGRSRYSLNSQLGSKMENVFSYCVPSKGEKAGYLDFKVPRKVPAGYTPMVTNPRAPSLYFLNLTRITVGKIKIAIASSLSQSLWTILDSGTEITRLPPVAYNTLKMAFRAAMTKYPLTAALGVMDTCFDLRNTNVTYPKITFHYDGLDVTLPKVGILYAISPSQVCLGFAGNADDSQITIIGNVLHRTMEITYDNERKRIGFAHDACE